MRYKILKHSFARLSLKHRFSTFERIVLSILFFMFFLYQPLQSQVGRAGGIVIQISNNIDFYNIDSVFIVDANVLIISNPKIKKKVTLPKGLINDIIDLVSHLNDDYFVYSVDNFFYGTIEGSLYERRRNTNSKVNDPELSYNKIINIPPFDSLGDGFLEWIYYYDQAAHCLVCQSEFWNPVLDPHSKQFNPYTIQGTASPRSKLLSYLDGNQSKSDSIGYWNLIEKYPNPPVCIGSMIFFADSSSNGLPYKIHIKPSRFFILRTWDVPFRVLKEKESVIADYPYLELTNNIENNWDEYRKKDTYLDNLESFVEAYVILSLLKKYKPYAFSKLKEASQKTLVPAKFPINVLEDNVATIIEEKDWESLSRLSIGICVDNKNEAELLLSIEMNNWKQNKTFNLSEKNINELSGIAKIDTIFNLKFLLYDALNKQPDSAYYLFVDYFKKVNLLNNSGNKLFLYGQGIYWLQNYIQSSRLINESSQSKLLTQSNEFDSLSRNLLSTKKLNIVNMFNHFVGTSLNNPLISMNQINEIIEITYGVGIIDIAKDAYPKKELWSNKYKDPEFIEIVRLISAAHYQAAMLLDSNSIEVLHFHYRFISYLKDLTQDNEESIVAMQKIINDKIFKTGK